MLLLKNTKKLKQHWRICIEEQVDCLNLFINWSPFTLFLSIRSKFLLHSYVAWIIHVFFVFANKLFKTIIDIVWLFFIKRWRWTMRGACRNIFKTRWSPQIRIFLKKNPCYDNLTVPKPKVKIIDGPGSTSLARQLDIENWTLINKTLELPQQDNNTDCGVSWNNTS